MSDQFYGSMGYSWYWVLIIGLVIGIVLVLRLFIQQWSAKRPDAVPVYINLPVETKANPATLRSLALQALAQIEQQVVSGKLSAHQGLVAMSAILREFAWRSTGVDYRTFTLRELRQTPHTELADTVAKMYPTLFGPRERMSIAAGAQLARKVVNTWTS